MPVVFDGVDRYGDGLAEPVQRKSAGPGRRRVASWLTRLPLIAARGGHGPDMYARDYTMQACNAANDCLRNQITTTNSKMSPNIRFLGPFLALAIITLSFPGQGQTLQEELRRLVAEHPRLKAEDNNVKAAKEGVRGAFANFLPKAGVTGNVGPERVDKPERRSIGLEPTELTRQKITFSLTQDLFTGFRNEEIYKASKVQKEIAELNRDAIRQVLLLEGITAYYSVLRQSRLIDVAVQNEKTIKEQLALEDERVARGAGIAVDILLAKTRLQLAKERRVQLEGTLSTAIARYKQAFSHAPNIGAMKVPDRKLGLLSKTFDQALDVAHQDNPALKASNRAIDVAQHRKKTAAADYYPQLNLAARFNYEDDVDGVEGVRRDWTFLAELSWDLFSGFATSANVAARSAERAALFDTYNFNRRKVEEELKIAWEQLLTARQRVGLLENAIIIAEEVFSARRRLRDAGKETAINVLDAESELFLARLNHLAALFDSDVAVYRILFAMGRLTPDNLGL